MFELKPQINIEVTLDRLIENWRIQDEVET